MSSSVGSLRRKSRGLQKIFQPIGSCPHDLKFFPGKIFWREILFTGFFPARKLKNPKIFRSKVEKRKKKLARKLEKKVLVLQLTHFSVVDRYRVRRTGNPKTRTFFGREIFFTRKFLD